MTDRELLELAARAGDIKRSIDWMGHPEYNPDWNPLRDDGDALRLFAKMRELYGPILLALFDDHVECGDESARHASIEIVNGDVAEATRRAITRSAAQIQLGKEKQ